jgi:hypothetical protein
VLTAQGKDGREAAALWSHNLGQRWGGSSSACFAQLALLVAQLLGLHLLALAGHWGWCVGGGISGNVGASAAVRRCWDVIEAAAAVHQRGFCRFGVGVGALVGQ